LKRNENRNQEIKKLKGPGSSHPHPENQKIKKLMFTLEHEVLFKMKNHTTQVFYFILGK
jgi:hypothetical protein